MAWAAAEMLPEAAYMHQQKACSIGQAEPCPEQSQGERLCAV